MFDVFTKMQSQIKNINYFQLDSIYRASSHLNVKVTYCITLYFDNVCTEQAKTCSIVSPCVIPVTFVKKKCCARNAQVSWRCADRRPSVRLYGEFLKSVIMSSRAPSFPSRT